MGNFNMLPTDIIFDILIRLPTESLVDCKLVSKSWNTIVGYKSFSQSHLNCLLKDLDSAGKFTFLLLTDTRPNLIRYREFHYLEYNSSEKLHRVIRMKLKPAPFMCYDVAGSCNGLVCLNGCHDNECLNYEPVYICNPITRECAFLPKCGRTDDLGKMLTGFGYVSSTDEYKVVRMYNLAVARDGEPPFVCVEVYTLGSGKGWRTTSKIFNQELDCFSVRGMLVNESIYWKNIDDKIVAFDLAKEILVDIPEGFHGFLRFKLGVNGVLLGYKVAIHRDNYFKTSDLVLVRKMEEDGSLCWIKEFSLSDTDTHDSIALSCRGTVIRRSSTEVQSHDLKSSSLQLLVEFEKDNYIFQAIPHINTLVSLKALGEQNTKTMETVDVPVREVDEEYTSQ